MKTALKLALFAVGAFALSAGATAADKHDPTGTWTVKINMGKRDVEHTLILDHKDGKVTGTQMSGKGTLTEIEEGTFKDGTVSVTVTRVSGTVRASVKYEGKLEGNTIKGVASFDFRGAVTKNDFEATREKRKD